ncbi:MAG: hypothetical protein P4M11_08740 [Candidatus Pacebacteria bacterium]|nr:hypothetical protein [Candidatus Paceibacterota bacterium]
MDEVSLAIRRIKATNEECKRAAQEQSAEVHTTLYRDLYFNEMLDGIQRLEAFSRLVQKVNYNMSCDNIVLATKQIAKLSKKVLAEEDFLHQLNVFDYINTQVEDCKTKLSTTIEGHILQFLFLANETSLRQRVEKLYGLYKKDFEMYIEAQANQRELSGDFGYMVKSTLLEKYLEYIYNDYSTSRMRQVDATLELLEKYEKERKTNIIVSSGLEKLMLNTESHLAVQNISHLVLLMYCYASLNSMTQLNEVSIITVMLE